MSLLSARDSFGSTREVPLLPLVCPTPAGDIGGYLLRAALRQKRPIRNGSLGETKGQDEF